MSRGALQDAGWAASVGPSSTIPAHRQTIPDRFTRVRPPLRIAALDEVPYPTGSPGAAAATIRHVWDGGRTQATVAVKDCRIWARPGHNKGRGRQGRQTWSKKAP
jgi:hypothetical protein